MRSAEEIEQVVVANVQGLPVLIKDVAEVGIGGAIRYGALTVDGKGEAVGGMVMMLKGGNSNAVIDHVKVRVAEIQKSMPEGVTIVPYHDRSELVKKTTSTVAGNLVEGGLIVIFILVLFLGNWRGGLIVASTIPLSLLFAFMMMRAFGVWANLMSLGAIDFGIIVDGAVIIVESAVFMMHKRILGGHALNRKDRDEVASEASGKMMNSAFFGQLIILIVFLPILALEGVEGKMFQPMALTFGFAIIGAMLLCLTYVPMIAATFLNARVNEKPGFGDKVVSRLENSFKPLLEKVLDHGKQFLAVCVVALALAVGVFSQMGGEFIPQLDEGDFAFHVIAKPGSALSETVDATTRVEQLVMKNFPEVKHVVSRIGVADVPTDPMPMDVADVIVNLQPEELWREGMTKHQLVEEVEALVKTVPGINFEFTQPIEMRFNELLTGVREDIAVKIYGDDLEVLARIARETGQLINGIEGIGDLKVEATTGQPQLNVKYKRELLAKYGASVAEVNQAIRTAFAGGVAGTIFQGERRFDLVVRLAEENRNDLEDLKHLFVRLDSGAKVPLQELAEITFEPGPMQISRDDTNRRTYVGINVRGRDVESLVNEIQEKLDAELKMPPGYFIRYGGAFENLERAKERLQVLVPVVLVLIFVLVYFALGSVKKTIMIYMAIPMATIGGVVSLWLRGMPFSISAGVGFIVLFGVAVLNGLVLIHGLDELEELPLRERILQGTTRRLRPILLTASTDILGFLPMALSNGAGAEVQRPLATVVIGGLFTACLLTLFVLPILYQFVHKDEHSKVVEVPPKAVMATLLLMVMPFFGKAQDQKQELSLEEALDRAYKNYPIMQQAGLNIEQQQALKKTAFNFGTTQLTTGGEEIGENGRGVYTPFMINQQNIDIFSMSAKSKYYKKAINAAEVEQQLQWQDLKRWVSQDWVRSSVDYARLQWVNRFMDINNDFERRAKMLYETEATNKLAYLAAQNKMQMLKNQQIQVEKEYQEQLAALQQWMMSDTLFTVAQAPEQFLSEVDADSVLLQQHPLIQYYEQQTMLAKQSVKVEQANYLPKLSVQYGWQTVEGQSGFYQWQGGITLPLVFNAQKGRVKAAKKVAERTEAVQQEQLARLQGRLNQSKINFEKWQLSVSNYRQSLLPVAEEQIQAAQLAYEVGEIDYVTFIQNLDNAMQAYQAYYQALEQLLLAQIDLEYLLVTL